MIVKTELKSVYFGVVFIKYVVGGGGEVGCAINFQT